MKNRKVGFLSIGIIVVFVLTISNLFLGLVREYKKNSRAIPEIYSELTKKITSLASNVPVENQFFLPSFINNFAGIENISSVELQYNGNQIYKFPAVLDSSTSPFIKNFTSRIETSNGNLSLNVSFFMLSPNAIFTHARFAFFLILIGTLASAVLLLYLYLFSTESEPRSDFLEETLPDDDATIFKQDSESQEQPEQQASDEDVLASTDAVENKPDVNEVQPEPLENLTGNETIQVSNEEPETVVLSEQQEDYHSSIASAIQETSDLPEILTEDSSAASVAEQAVENTPFPDEEAALETDEQKNEIQKSQAEQFSESESDAEPDVQQEENILAGMQLSLVSQLESKLVNAASSEKDLSLLVIRLPGIQFSSDLKAKINNALTEFFTFEDLIFDFKQDGFAVILSATTLDDALLKAEEIHSRLASVLSENEIHVVPVIGLASRSLRLISAERLITEAEQAAVHAEEDLSAPIVAFRVNPEKYRQFISETDN